MEKLTREALSLFGIHLNKNQVAALELFSRELLDWNQKFNLTAIRDAESIRTKHFLDSFSCVLAWKNAPPNCLIDIGTGAGFPGLPLKILYPRMQLTLVESVGKKAGFCRHMVEKLDLKDVEVLQMRAEDAGQMDAFIRLLLSRGNAKLLSSPNLIVSAGDEASIITGEEVPVQSATVVSGSVSTTTLFKRVGIKLRVIPLQITNDTAMVEINPEVSAVTGYTVAGAGVSNPIVAIRNVNTTLSLKDGEILTIGGLLRSEDRDLVRKVPFLGDIPGVGVLFQSRRSQSVKTQLIFFLRINILGQGKQHGLMYHRPGVGLERLDTQVERTTPRQRELDPMKLPPFEPDSPTPAPENAPAPAPENPAKPAPAGDAEKQAVQAPK